MGDYFQRSSSPKGKRGKHHQPKNGVSRSHRVVNVAPQYDDDDDTRVDEYDDDVDYYGDDAPAQNGYGDVKSHSRMPRRQQPNKDKSSVWQKMKKGMGKKKSQRNQVGVETLLSYYTMIENIGFEHVTQ